MKLEVQQAKAEVYNDLLTTYAQTFPAEQQFWVAMLFYFSKDFSIWYWIVAFLFHVDQELTKFWAKNEDEQSSFFVEA